MSKHRRYILWVFILTALLSVAIGCRHESRAKKFRIGFAQCCDDAWRDVMNQEMYRELAFHPELELEMRVSDNNSEKQVAQIREMLKIGIDLLIVSPNESRPLTAIVEEVYKSGIPVILLDRKTDSEQYTAYLGADNYEVGETAAKYIISQFKGQGKVIELQLGLTISPAAERHRGFRAGIASAPGLEVVDVLENTTLNMADLSNKFPDMLRNHPEVNIIFGHTDLLAETAYKIAQEQGRAGDLFFIGIDGIPGTGQGIQAVEDGILDASMLYPTGGSDAIQLALGILNNLPYEKKNNLQTIVINSVNARILHNQMKKVNSLQQSIDEQMQGLESLKSIYQNQRIYIAVLLSSLLLTLVLGVFLWKSLRTKQAANLSLERKNEEILEHERQLVEMSDEVRLATQAKVDFFTNVSHEFRTPLTLILGFAEDLLPSPKLSEDMQQSIGHIRQNAFRLLRLVNQLMDFRKTESGQMKLKASENDLVLFVKNIMETYSKTARKREIDFQLLTRHEQLTVWFDVNTIDKVLFNLFSNAFKYTPDGGKIHLAISVDNFENTVKLSVEDNGKGMREEEVAHIFDPFFQGEERQLAGTGLGLSLSKLLVELHSGSLAVKSSKNKGSRFTVTLPLGRAHLQEEQLAAVGAQHSNNQEFLFIPETVGAETPEAVESATGAWQILIIEDNEDLQFFLKKKLSPAYRIIQESEGNKGLQQAFDLTPDLIICDIMLPGMNGLEIIRILKADLRTSHIPVVLLSARSTMEQQIEGIQTGADAYITKPFNIHFLQANIRSLLLNRQVLKESYGRNMVVFSTKQPELSENANPLDHDFLKKFVDYIEQHHTQQDFQVSDLCREFGLSRSQLYRKVMALFGESISDYIQNLRLKKAEALLLGSRLSVTEIAYRVGYSAPDYFSTVFRSKYGVTPSGFRKQTEE